jgi:hypothetical protein
MRWSHPPPVALERDSTSVCSMRRFDAPIPTFVGMEIWLQLIRKDTSRYGFRRLTESLLSRAPHSHDSEQLAAAKARLFGDPQEPQADLLRRLKFDGVVPRQIDGAGGHH